MAFEEFEIESVKFFLDELGRSNDTVDVDEGGLSSVHFVVIRVFEERWVTLVVLVAMQDVSLDWHGTVHRCHRRRGHVRLRT